MNSFNADTTEAVAQDLYRQHRARNGFPEAVFGEWDNAGSHQARFRADAREILMGLQRHGHPDPQPDTDDLADRAAALATKYRQQADALRSRKSSSPYDAGQDEYEWAQDANIIDGVAADIEALLSTRP